jgi:hypothetical protein
MFGFSVCIWQIKYVESENIESESWKLLLILLRIKLLFSRSNYVCPILIFIFVAEQAQIYFACTHLPSRFTISRDTKQKSKEANTLFNVVSIGSNTFTSLLAAMIHSTCHRRRERQSYYRCVSHQKVGAERISLVYFILRATVCWLLLCICHLYMNVEICLDSNPES